MLGFERPKYEHEKQSKSHMCNLTNQQLEQGNIEGTRYVDFTVKEKDKKALNDHFSKNQNFYLGREFTLKLPNISSGDQSELNIKNRATQIHMAVSTYEQNNMLYINPSRVSGVFGGKNKLFTTAHGIRNVIKSEGRISEKDKNRLFIYDDYGQRINPYYVKFDDANDAAIIYFKPTDATNGIPDVTMSAINNTEDLVGLGGSNDNEQFDASYDFFSIKTLRVTQGTNILVKGILGGTAEAGDSGSGIYGQNDGFPKGIIDKINCKTNQTSFTGISVYLALDMRR